LKSTSVRAIFKKRLRRRSAPESIFRVSVGIIKPTIIVRGNIVVTFQVVRCSDQSAPTSRSSIRFLGLLGDKILSCLPAPRTTASSPGSLVASVEPRISQMLAKAGPVRKPAKIRIIW
jgi:hypothetical protein